MTQTLEERIKNLERELALKQAYLTVQFSFPKGNKLPEDVKTQVTEELKNACTRLAEDRENSDNTTSASLGLTEEDVSILKQIVQAAKSRMPTNNTPAATKVAFKQETTEQPSETHNADLEGVKRAILVSTEAVPRQYRARIGSNEEVYVNSVKDGLASITIKKIATVVRDIPIEDLDFNL